MDGGDGIDRVRIDDRLGAECRGERAALRDGVDGDDTAPMATPSIVALSPTGPCPKTASVSRPDTSRRFNAPYAVPVPHEMAAPSSKEITSGIGTSVLAGTTMNGACAPLPVMP